MALSLFAFQVRRAPLTLSRRLLISSSLRLISTSPSPSFSRHFPALSPFDRLNDLPQTPFTSLLQRQLAALEEDLSRSMTALYHPTEFETDPAAKELMSWTSSDHPSDAKEGEGRKFRSVEIIKHREGREGKWQVEVYAQDGQAPEGSALKEGKLLAKGEAEKEEEALAQASKKALEIIKGQQAIEGAAPAEQKKVEGEKQEQK
ncbi:hypothetical protein JCM11251_006794 [Rhodosporidiobolus azoricus]